MINSFLNLFTEQQGSLLVAPIALTSYQHVPSPRLVGIESNPGPPKTRGRSRSRNSTRTRNVPRNTTVVPRNFGIVAPRTKLTMRYYEETAQTSTAGGFSTQIYNLNSLFDPDRTGSGHQPMGFDQVSALYSKYLVTAVRWQISVWQNAVGFIGNLTASVCPINQAGAVSGPQDFIEQPRSVWKTGNMQNDTIHFTGSINLWDLAAKSKQAYFDDDTYSAAVGSTPGELMTLQIGVSNLRGDTIQVFSATMLHFEAEFFDPVPISGS
jgi:hypothetical protein